MGTNRKKRAKKKIDKHALDMHNVENYMAAIAAVYHMFRTWITYQDLLEYPHLQKTGLNAGC